MYLSEPVQRNGVCCVGVCMRCKTVDFMIVHAAGTDHHCGRESSLPLMSRESVVDPQGTQFHINPRSDFAYTSDGIPLLSVGIATVFDDSSQPVVTDCRNVHGRTGFRRDRTKEKARSCKARARASPCGKEVY